MINDNTIRKVEIANDINEEIYHKCNNTAKSVEEFIKYTNEIVNKEMNIVSEKICEEIVELEKTGYITNEYQLKISVEYMVDKHISNLLFNKFLSYVKNLEMKTFTFNSYKLKDIINYIKNNNNKNDKLSEIIENLTNEKFNK